MALDAEAPLVTYRTYFRGELLAIDGRGRDAMRRVNVREPGWTTWVTVGERRWRVWPSREAA